MDSLYTAFAQDANGWLPMNEHVPHDAMILICVAIHSTDENGMFREKYDHGIAWWRSDLNRWDSELHYIDSPEYKNLKLEYWKPLDVPVLYAMRDSYRSIIAEHSQKQDVNKL